MISPYLLDARISIRLIEHSPSISLVLALDGFDFRRGALIDSACATEHRSGGAPLRVSAVFSRSVHGPDSFA
jgi:hypothetical protein